MVGRCCNKRSGRCCSGQSESVATNGRGGVATDIVGKCCNKRSGRCCNGQSESVATNSRGGVATDSQKVLQQTVGEVLQQMVGDVLQWIVGRCCNGQERCCNEQERWDGKGIAIFDGGWTTVNDATAMYGSYRKSCNKVPCTLRRCG